MKKKFFSLINILIISAYVLSLTDNTILYAQDNGNDQVEEIVEDTTSETTEETKVESVEETEVEIIEEPVSETTEEPVAETTEKDVDDKANEEELESLELDEQRIESNVGYVFDENGVIIEEIDVASEQSAPMLRSSRAMPSNFGVGYVSFANYSGYVLNVYTSASSSTTYTYFNTGSSGVVPTLGMEGSRIKVVINGYVGYINNNSAFNYISLNTPGISEYYSKNSNGDFVFTYNYYGRNASIVTGPAPSFINAGTHYYSLDGNHFYTNRQAMFNDFVSGSRASAVNKTAYYNYYQYLPFRSTTNLTAKNFIDFLNSKVPTSTYSVLRDNNSINQFFTSQNNHGVNAAMEFSMAMLESGYGTSSIARNKNNLFGWGAVDSSPGAGAYAFSTVAAGIEYHVDNGISSGYLDSVTDYRYRGSNLGNKSIGLNVLYASDPYWGMKIAGLYYLMDKNSGFVDYNSNTIAIKQGYSTPQTYFQGNPIYKLENGVNKFSFNNQPFLVVSKSGSTLTINSDIAICNPGDIASSPRIRNGVYQIRNYDCPVGKAQFAADYSLAKDQVQVSDSSMRLIGKPLSNLPITASNIRVIQVKDGIVELKLEGLNAPSGINSLNVAVWSKKNGQDDIRWYDFKLAKDGAYYTTFNIATHNGEIGEYFLHVYGRNANNTLNLVVGKESNLTSPPSYGLNIKNSSTSTRTFEVTGVNNKNFDYISVAVWSEVNGKDDLKWYATKPNPNGTYSYTLSLDEHLYNNGRYNVHVYGFRSSIYPILLTTNTFTYSSGDLITYNTTNSYNSFDVNIVENGNPNIVEYTTAVWTNKWGQDDIRWYGGKSFNVSSFNHKNESGVYQVHTYGKLRTGTYVFVKSTEVKVETLNYTPGTYLKKVSNTEFDVIVVSTSELKSMPIAVWTHRNGQDDIKWYYATKVSSNTFSLRVNIGNHNYEYGEYLIHSYGVHNNGQMKFISGKIMTVEGIKVESKSAVTNSTNANLKLNNVTSPHGIRNMRVAVWSDANGQDDIRWYNVPNTGNNFEINVSSLNHKGNEGSYTAHFYATDNYGKSVLVTGLSFRITSVKMSSVTFEKVSRDSFEIVVRGYESPRSTNTIYVPTWSSVGGQDDVRWYQATRRSDGTYRYTVYTRNHNNSLGTYYVDPYGYSGNGQLIFLGRGTVNVFNVKGYLNVNVTSNTFNLKMTNINISSSLKEVNIAVWSANNGQDDIRWYSAKRNSDGSYSVNVPISNHGNERGAYFFHTYGRDVYNNSYFLDGVIKYR